MKILCICHGGNVRSVALKFLLHQKYKHDALACGQAFNTPETIKMLCGWADYIVVVQPGIAECVSEEYRKKTFCYNIGEDRFGYAFHPELIKGMDTMIQQHGLFNK